MKKGLKGKLTEVTMNAKKLAGEKAVEFIENGMTIGLGTGSTVYWTIRKLGELVQRGELQVRGIPTSKSTEELATNLGIPLVTFADVKELDLTIDGADEINPALDMIKGGGGALLREKLVAASSRRLVIVADETKLVSALGSFSLPIEVVPFAWETTMQRIASLNCIPALRSVDSKPYITDNGNYILDCAFGSIPDPAGLDQTLKLLTGVVETGLFVGVVDTVIVGCDDGVKLLSNK
jgi:ribose 5-phosphate isomerase A